MNYGFRFQAFAGQPYTVAAIDGVVIENYWEAANRKLAAEIQTAVAAFVAKGIQVHVYHTFDPGVAREEVNAY